MIHNHIIIRFSYTQIERKILIIESQQTWYSSTQCSRSREQVRSWNFQLSNWWNAPYVQGTVFESFSFWNQVKRLAGVAVLINYCFPLIIVVGERTSARGYSRTENEFFGHRVWTIVREVGRNEIASKTHSRCRTRISPKTINQNESSFS